MTQPADLVNRAMDALGLGLVIGDIDDGNVESEVARRWYGQELRALLRTANWAFARKRAPLQILGDATGQTPGAGTQVEQGWIYAYAWPIDGVRARWLPWSGAWPSGLAFAGVPPMPGQISLPTNIPLMPNLGVSPIGPWERPARFLCAVTDQYPVEIGQLPWDQRPDLEHIEGVGPNNRRIILTNVPPAGSGGAMVGCQLVYTFLCHEIEVWDELFQAAFVATLASRFALPMIAGKADATPLDKQRAVAERNTQVAIAKNAIRDARVASAQEAGFPMRTDHEPDWLRRRRTGRARWGAWGEYDGGGVGPGYTYFGWEGMSFADGSVF